MDLCGFHSDICMLPNWVFCRKISLKGMSTFMCDNIHISTCSVKVCKHKRGMIIWQISHIATNCLRFSSKNIQQLIFHHKIKKFFCFLWKFTIHFLSLCQYLLRTAWRLWISFRSINLFIWKIQVLQIQTSFSFFIQAFWKWNPVFFHLSAQSFYLLLSITVSLHPSISQLRIGIKSKKFCLLGTIFYQLIIDFIQFICNT